MTTLKSYFTEKSQMFKAFFLILKVFYIASALMLIKFCMEFEFTDTAFMIPALVMLILQFAAAVYAEKAIRSDNSLGLLIGLILALLMTFSIFFPVGLFGFFALLNKDFRNDYLLSNRPLWLCLFYDQLDQWTSAKQA